MPGILWRIIIAVVSCLLAYLLIPPVCRVIGVTLSGDVETILKVCIAGIALFYILRGTTWPWNRP